jgi:cysteine desulfurase/selenocysteine lyase
MTATAGSADPAVPTSPLNVERLRDDFPILKQSVHGHSLAYLDNAATTQKPHTVIDALRHYYESSNANIHRGVHDLSVRATATYEAARGKIQRFINASRPAEVVFVRGATEAINLVAQTHGRSEFGPGDDVIISTLEHHSNIVPWQMLCAQTGATLKVIPIDDRGDLEMDTYQQLLSERTRLVAVSHVSNALGTINPVREIADLAHGVGAVVLIDGAQAVPHMTVDVQALNCDYYAFSAHKMFGPTAAGALYGRFDHLETLPPYQGGGDMIASVTLDATTYNELPYRLEAGTPNISGTIGFGAAVDYLQAIGLDRIAAYEAELLAYGTQALMDIPEVRLIGNATHKAAVLSFVVGEIHAHDVGTILDQLGIAVRTGHHCAQPVMDRYGVPATVRASLAMYNTKAEIDRLADGIRKVIEVFG